MSAAKSERLLNLVILLLVARNYTTKDQIRALMEPYRESSDEAFDRMFERDKDDLRALGIPLEVGFVDKFFEDEQGYRIKRDAFELPEIDFAADEVAVLGLAARVWRHAGLAAATSDALVKLKAAGLSFDREQLDQVAPALAAEEPAFEAMWQATVHRTPVRFDYTRAGETRVAHAAPPAVGRDHGPGPLVRRRPRHRPRRAPDVPAQPDRVRCHRRRRRRAPTRFPRAPTCARCPRRSPRGEPDRSAVVLARPGAANGLRRRATVSATGVTGPDGTLGWDELQVPYVSESDFAGELLGYADAVVVESPAELRRRRGRAAGRGRRPSASSAAGATTMSGAREQVSRLLALVPYLQTRTDVSLAQVAADFGVRPDQIMKDLKVLWMCGLPGLTPDKMIDVDFEAIEDDPDGVVRIDNADFLSRPVRLGSSEASALIVALRALREGSPDTSHDVIDRCLVKLEDATASGTAAPPVALHLPTVTRGSAAGRWCCEQAIRATARPASTTTCPPATRPPGAPSTRWSCSPAKDTTTWTPGATSRRHVVCSGSTGCTRSRSWTSRARSTT